MKLSLPEIVHALARDNEISGAEIYDTIEFLMEDVCNDRATILKVGRMVKALVDYEKAPVS